MHGDTCIISYDNVVKILSVFLFNIVDATVRHYTSYINQFACITR
ncbi:hypothetical protein APH_0518 [Anaplasma phagocytophilum str. HZ]|uniref:Uncharacterized protein n=1 Tax=Anaplasma phagocytophilum (strain HZ) TaxID=212042 RepID=Q2GKI8_ANAPZ|nr:hypothetical protein APH_0518 [Anaplasma phagocytophilum str. HZ]